MLGNNMFVYCLNNPVNYVDSQGKSAEAIQWWTVGAAWLPAIDTILPIGDLLYLGGICLFGYIALSGEQESVPEIGYDEPAVAYIPPSPNDDDDDDDDDDDYYEEENNFGGRQKVGKSKGKTPGNNQAQNKQFSDATKGLTPSQKRIVHNLISKKNYGYQEIKTLVKELFVFIIGLFAIEVE